MGVQRRVNWLGQERVEVSHLRLLESSEAADFDALGYAIAKDLPLIIRGLTLNANGIGGKATSLLLSVANAQFINWRAAEAGSMFLLPLDAADEVLSGANTRVTGGFTPSATNYVSLDVVSVADPDSVDTVRFKDADTGVEFPASVPVTRVIDWRMFISTVPFSQGVGRVPVAQVVTDANNNVTSITDSRSLLFRLNTERRMLTANASTSSNPAIDPFIGGDKDIGSLREWMEVVMTRLLDLGGAAHWYEYSPYQPASTTDLGFVKLYSAAVDPVNPTVPVVNGSGYVVARGIVRDTAGILSIGTDSDTTNIFGTIHAPQGFAGLNAGDNGITATGNGTGEGVRGTGGTGSGAGVRGIGGSTDGNGVYGTGTGSGSGVRGLGGVTNGIGVRGDGNGNGVGIAGFGAGTGAGVIGTGGATGAGVWAVGNAARGALNLTPQATPSSPANGDVWVDSTDYVFHVKGRVSTPVTENGTGNSYDFNTGWTAGQPAPYFYKNAIGEVCLSGAVSSTGGTDYVFRLPVGYRPANSVYFPVYAHNGATVILGLATVDDSGYVNVNRLTPGGGSSIASNGDVFYLSPVRFSTDFPPI